MARLVEEKLLLSVSGQWSQDGREVVSGSFCLL